MKLYSKFTFGKYKGLTLQEVYQGTLNPSQELISRYLNHILNNIHHNVPLSAHFEFIDKFKVTKNIIEVIGTQEFWETGVNNKGKSIGVVGEVFLGNLQNELKQIIDYHFKSNWLGILETLSEFNSYQNERLPIGGDPQYLIWCMKEIDGYFIEEQSMKDLQSLSYCELTGIDVLYVQNNVYEYAPIINLRQPYFQTLHTI